MFAYCLNNPLLLVDSSGTRPVIGLTVSGETKKERKQSFEFMRYLQQRKNELIRFAAIVYAEAGETNRKTKAAAAHSIKNRIVLNHWTAPSTIMEAISYPDQYNGYGIESYNNAVMYFTTGRINVNCLEIAAMRESMSVVIPIYDNIEPDFTGGIMYFHSFTNASDWQYHNYYQQVIIPGTEIFWWYKE